MTAVTTIASSIGVGAYRRRHRRRRRAHGPAPDGRGHRPQPAVHRRADRRRSALVMGKTAENLHDRFPQLTKARATRSPSTASDKLAAAYAAGKIQPDLVPVATRHGSRAGASRPPTSRRGPGTTLEDLGGLKTPFRPHGSVTAGNAAGLNDGATACLLAVRDGRRRARPPVRMRMVVLRLRRRRARGHGHRPRARHREGAAQGRPDDRRHRPVRAQRGVRRAGPRLPRPLRHRRRRPAGQPLRRRHRHRPSARVLWRAPDDPARPPVRGAPRGALRPDRDVHRPRPGRHRHLGEPAPRRHGQEAEP